MNPDVSSITRGGEKIGGNSARVIFVILAIAFVFSYFIRLSTGVLGPKLMEDLHIDIAQLGLLTSSFFYAFALMQIPVGIALDSFSSKYVIIGTLLLAIIGCSMFASAGSYSIALWGRILIGIGMSSVLMGSLKILGNWFRPDQFAFLSGIMLSLGNLGALVSATPLVIADSVIGWRNCFWVFTLFLLLLSAIILCFVKDRPEKCEMCDLTATSLKAFPVMSILLSSLKTVFFNRHFWIISLSTFIRYGSLISIQGFLGTLYLVHVIGYSDQISGNILGMIAIGYLVGSPLLGRASDLIFKSRKKIMVWGLFLYAFFMVFFFFDVRNELLWYVVFFALGFFASIGVVGMAHVKELFPKEITGFVLTANNLFTIGGVAVSQHIVAMVITQYQKTLTGHLAEAYHAAFAVLLVACISIFFLYFFVEDSKLLLSTQKKSHEKRSVLER